MGLPTDFEISVSGNIKKKPPRRSSKKGSGSGGSGGGGKGGTPPLDFGASARAENIGNRIELALKGVNFVIHFINDKIQEKRLRESWDNLKPFIERRLKDEPSTGILIIVQFGAREKELSENETPLEHTSRFLGIDVAYGLTESEAWEAWISQPRLSDSVGLKISYQRIFLAPRNAVDFTKIQTPFRAYGIGTFISGGASLMKIAWKGLWGFDEIGDVKLAVPKGFTPKFLLLSAPAKIEWRNGAIQKTTDIPRMWVDAASSDYEVSEGIWVIDMDRGIWNVGEDKAAMIFPFDNATDELFQGVARTKDDLGQLKRFVNINKLRWARPENIHILQKFAEDRRISTDTPDVPSNAKEPPLMR
jgi:hypothetical protein